MTDIYTQLKNRAQTLWEPENLLNEKIVITARALSTQEAIGNPEDDDYPIQKGNEKLMQAEFKGSCGQAFTDHFGNFEGTLKDILDMPLTNNFQKAVFISALNAVLRFQGKADKTIHCHDEEPVACAVKLVAYIREHYGDVKITQIGFQPRMAQHLVPVFPLRLIDLDPENIGQKKQGVLIEGADATDDAIDWCDLLLVTGTTVANGSIELFLNRKPILFYGTTIAGAAELMGWDRFCLKAT
ncbi:MULTISPECIES: Rossmann-like domain-containing protein [Desulfobacula]|uniref:Conserved uncharacterized protein n=2 Tax=Desulfobacula TaxID=28222 RepID=K0NE58_DESTT|nr:MULTISPECIES: DUF364 domain-containing protein [Desulfobacula]CCK79100.1 conserved uncharacterized protein [Desulfobacula toluolica Tol2]SDU06940.1 Putative heavy-metal chelation [Desulfobacula phenolica]